MNAQNSGDARTAARSQRRTSAEVRELLLAAARELFEARGFANTSTRAIAERAGVSPTVLFRHFGSKQALHDQIHGSAPPEVGSHPRRATRSESETRILLLESARELFSAQGYAKTSTRQIAEHAGVQEVSLFRYFGNKAAIFRQSILDPFGDFIREQGQRIPADDRQQGTNLATRAFLGGLYNVLLERRDALLTLVAARLHEGSDVMGAGDQQAAMNEILGPLEAQVRLDCEAAGIDAINIPVATRITIAMIGGTAIFKDWLFAGTDGVSDEAITEEMVRYVSRAFS